jgi:hypothetical protein
MNAGAPAERRGDRWCAVAVAVLVLVVVGCTSEAPIASNVVPPPATSGERVSFVTLGGNETVSRGLDESVNLPWNQQVFSELPLSTTFANVASTDATVASGVAEQLPKALAERPTLAVVWFGLGDFTVKTATGAFATDLTQMVKALQGAGAKVLLIARTQPDQGDALNRFNAAIIDVGTTTGATVVKIEGHDTLRNPVEHGAIAKAIEAAL